MNLKHASRLLTYRYMVEREKELYIEYLGLTFKTFTTVDFPVPLAYEPQLLCGPARDFYPPTRNQHTTNRTPCLLNYVYTGMEHQQIERHTHYTITYK